MKTKLQHGNSIRRYYPTEICNASATNKSHRIPQATEVQKLADDLYRLIQLFQLTYHECNNIIRKEFGEGVGLQTFWFHFLDRNYGVGFTPRDKTLRKYRHLQTFLTNKEKEFAKDKRSTKV